METNPALFFRQSHEKTICTVLTEIFKRAFVAIKEMLVRVMCSSFDGIILYDLSVPAKDEVRHNRIRRALMSLLVSYRWNTSQS